MFENDELPSDIISPFDEIDMTQEELNEKKLLDYDKKQIFEAIPLKKSKIAFDLYFDDCLNQMPPEDKREFVKQCLSLLVETYAMGYIEDYVNRNNLFENKLDVIIGLIKYICEDEWLFSLMPCIEKIPLEVIFNKETLRDFIEARVKTIRSRIEQSEQINELIKEFIVNAPSEDALVLIYKLINKDLVGVVSIQLQQP